MSVPTAHKILISAAIAFLLVFAVHELATYRASGAAPDLLWSAAALAAAVGFAAYLRRYARALGRS